MNNVCTYLIYKIYNGHGDFTGLNEFWARKQELNAGLIW